MEILNKSETVSFIEKQFPVSKISKECYKEKKAGSNQTLTGLGKWWGRKPLLLVRAIILGILIPSTENPKKDRDIFLKILTMDNEGLKLRKNKPINIDLIFENLTSTEKQRYFGEGKNVLRKGLTVEEKNYIQNLVFERLSYDKKLNYCLRPEEVEIKGILEWNEINNYLNTNSFNLKDLIAELAKKKFNKIPKVGDCFCGGGSIPFESARLGLNIYASELNPIALLLTWAALNLLGSNETEIKDLNKFQEKIFNKLIDIYKENKLEINEDHEMCKYYLYCLETICPECGFKVPLSPNWIIDLSTKTVALLEENADSKSFDIFIKQNASAEDFIHAEYTATVKKSKLFCPSCKKFSPISFLRKENKSSNNAAANGFRQWEKDDIIDKKGDVFVERLYCLKYFNKNNDRSWGEFIKKPPPATDATYGQSRYASPILEDIVREEDVKETIKNKFDYWQKSNFIKKSRIEDGNETTRLSKERGWTYWHQLFNHRQLLINGLLLELIATEAENINEHVIGLLAFNRCLDWNSKLCIWNNGRGTLQATYTNQALNTMFNYGARTVSSLYSIFKINISDHILNVEKDLKLCDARQVNQECDIWITDPPYADAINYHELSEFFLSWDIKILEKIFPDWYFDSKRALAVQGESKDFYKSMIEIYRNLAMHMPDNGIQVVMFTHQSVRVWADLTLILWQAGLQVVSAWNIATETESGGLKKGGNYIKGTVIIVLRKQQSNKTAFLDELQQLVEQEVKYQIDSMKDIDDMDEPNFDDPDYLLAAYAASLKVLTSYKNIEDVDINYELSKQRNENEASKVEQIINQAVKIAYDYLIPEGFDQYNWKLLTPVERFYIKGMEIEKNGNYELSSYQELARGFGVKDYKEYLVSVKANNARLKNATELGTRAFSQDNFSNTIIRNIFLALNQAIKEEKALNGKNWLRNEVPNYWNSRNLIIEILEFISRFEHIQNMIHWKNEAIYSKLMKELIKNDGI